MITVQIRLKPDADQASLLTETMARVNLAANAAAKTALAKRVFNQCNLHKIVYRQLRDDFDLPSQLAIKAISKAVFVFARDKKTLPHFRPDGAIPYDQRILSYKSGDRVSLTTVGGRLVIPFVCGARQRDLLKNPRKQAQLIRRGNDFYLHISVETPTVPVAEATECLGVDLGIVNIATTSDGEVFCGKNLKRVRKSRQARRSTLQSVNTRSARRRLRKLSGKQARFTKDVNHVISKRLVRKAKALGVGIALENLTGIRKHVKTTVKPLRSELGRWAFHQLRSYIEYKAAMAGVAVRVVKAAYTSVTCSVCGHCDKANRPDRNSFLCEQCGHSAPADVNAAVNIGAKGRLAGPCQLPYGIEA